MNHTTSGQGFGYWQNIHGCSYVPDIMNADSFQHTLSWSTKRDLGWVRDGDDGPLKHLDCGFPGYYCFTTTGHTLELGDIIRLGIIQGGDHLVFIKRMVVNPYNSYISPYNGKRHVYFNGTNYAGHEIAIGNLLWADINFSGDWFQIGGLVGESQGTGFTDAYIVGDTLYLTVKGIQAWCKVLLKQGSVVRQMPLHYKMLFGIESDPATWALPIDLPADGDYTIEAYSYASNGQDRADTFYVSIQNGPPNAPLLESVDLDNDAGKVNLLWQDGGNYTQTFQVVQNSNTIAELPDTITEYSHDYLWGSRTFTYTVAAENSNGVAPAVDTVYVTSLPNRPCNLRGYVHRVDSLIGSYGKVKPENPPGPYINTITLDWDKPPKNLREIVGYRLYVSHYLTGSQYVYEYFWIDSTSITLSELQPFRQYNFRLRAFDDYGDSSLFTGLFSLTTGQWDPYNQPAWAQKDNTGKPSFRLSQNYPNPFNANTSITVEIELGDHVSLKIYNILGQNIRTLYDEFMDMGIHTVCWDGLDGQGLSAASGIYFIRIDVGNKIESRKMLLLK